MEPSINISNLPQTPSICNQIVKLMKGRGGELSATWGVTKQTISDQVTRLKEGKKLTPKSWARYAELYVEALKTQKSVEQYLNS